MKNIIAPLLISLLAIGCGSDQGTSDQGAKQPPVQNVNNPNPNQKPNPGQRESDAFAQLQKLDGNWVARDFQSQSQLAITVTRDEITVTKSQPGAQAPEMNVISVNSEGGKIVLLVAQDSSAEQPEAEYIFGVNNNSLTEFVRSASSSLVPAATYCKVGSTCAQTSRSNPVNTQMPARPQNGFGTQPQNGFGTQPQKWLWHSASKWLRHSASKWLWHSASNWLWHSASKWLWHSASKRLWHAASKRLWHAASKWFWHAASKWLWHSASKWFWHAASKRLWHAASKWLRWSDASYRV